MKPSDEIRKMLHLPPISQIGVVVRDIDKTVEYYESVFGIGPFNIVEGEGMATLMDGREVKTRGRLAFAEFGPVQLELIQILEGDSIHVDFLREKGEGLHHLGFSVSDFDERIAACEQLGIRSLQTGIGARRYTYLDTESTGGVIFELIEDGS